MDYVFALQPEKLPELLLLSNELILRCLGLVEKDCFGGDEQMNMTKLGEAAANRGIFSSSVVAALFLIMYWS